MGENVLFQLALCVPSVRVRLHWVGQLGGVLGVTLAVDEHQRIPLVALDYVGDAVKML